MTYQLTDIAAISSFIRGGNATFTIKSLTSCAHYTYNIRKKSGSNIYFITTNNNYLGYLKDNEVRLTAKSNFDATSPEVVAIRFLLSNLAAGHINKNLAFYHEGRCCVCGRPLTDPASIERGIGPTCMAKGV